MLLCREAPVSLIGSEVAVHQYNIEAHITNQKAWLEYAHYATEP